MTTKYLIAREGLRWEGPFEWDKLARAIRLGANKNQCITIEALEALGYSVRELASISVVAEVKSNGSFHPADVMSVNAVLAKFSSKKVRITVEEFME